MALTDESAALRARNLITERGEGAIGLSIPKIISIIPTALEIWAQEAVKIPTSRREFEQQIEIEIENGTADFAPYFDGSLQNIERTSIGAGANVSLKALETPVKWVHSLTQLKYPRNLGGLFIAIFLDGNILRCRNTDGSLTSLNAALQGTFVVIPKDTSEVPFNLEGDFLSALARMAISEIGMAGKK